MKIIKPMVVSFTFRAFQMLGQQRLCVTSMVGFRLGIDERRLIPDTDLWKAIGETTSGIVNEGLPKPCGEVLVFGACHTPQGRPVPLSYVRVRVAPVEADARRTVDKKLFVFGDRHWRSGILGRAMTDSAPFTEMPLGWERAFGAESYAKNPLGRGITPAEGTDDIPLPNVELAAHSVSSPSQRPEPAGFGPLEMGWPQRQSKAGAYDDRWLQEDFPGFARDADPSFFNMAPPDQRIQGVFRGDEEYVLENMHPSRQVLRGRLPSVAARVLLRRKGYRDPEEVKTQLDTLVFLPGKEIGVLVFRGTTPVLEDDAEDILQALAACEELGEARSSQHYTRALDRRLDKDQSPLLALLADDLVPSFAAGGDLAALGLGADLAEREREREEKREQLAKAGVDLPDAGKVVPDAAAPTAAAPAASASQAAPAGSGAPGPPVAPPPSAAPPLPPEPPVEPSPETAAAPRRPKVGKGPPKAEAPVLMTLREASAKSDAATDEKLRKLQRRDAQALESYREGAHYQPPARALEPSERERARTVMMELRAEGKSFAGLDWTRHDLSGVDLQKGDFRKTLLEAADLTGTNVAGADMSGAVLAHATLRNTCFDGATLEEANLGATVMDGTTFEGANLRKAIFVLTNLRSVSLRGADLTKIEFLLAEFGAVDFEGAVTAGLDFLPGHDLTRCRFPGAKLAKSNLLETKIDGVDFASADLQSVTCVKVSANGACFAGASMRKFVAVEGCSFERANFAGADLTGAVIRGANMREANLEGASLEGANLTECDLTGATLTGAQAKELVAIRANLTNATMRGANLMEAMLQKAMLHGTDLSATNLFLANLSLARLSTSTKVTGANLKRALMLPRARKGS